MKLTQIVSGKWIVAIFIFLVSFLFAAASYSFTLNWLELNSSERFEEFVNEIQHTIAKDMRIYEDALFAGKAVFLASEQVTRSEWRIFVESQDLEVRLPGTSSFFYAEFVEGRNVPKFIESLRRDKSTNKVGYEFITTPEISAQKNLLIKYVEPDDAVRIKALGFNISTSGIKGVLENLSSNQIGITDKIPFPLTTQDLIVAYYIPVARRGQGVEGMVGLTFQVQELFTLLTSNIPMSSQYALQITQEDGLLLFTGGNLHYLGSDNNLEEIFSVEVADKVWSGRVLGDNLFGTNEFERNLPTSISLGVFILILLAQGIVGTYFIVGNIRLSRETKEIRNDLISVVSHQIRTPLTSIKWMVDILRDETEITDQEKAGYLNNIFDSSQKMIEIANDLLHMTRVSGGVFEMPAKEEVKISRLVSILVKGLRIRSENKEVKLLFDEPKEELVILADEGMIKQALLNVLENAIDYSTKGTQVVVSMGSISNSVIIRIEDQGIGIPAKEQKKIFGRFYRGDRAKRFMSEGSGLGLFVAKNIIEAHSGSISYKPRKDGGSIFTMRLPTKGTNFGSINRKQKNEKSTI